MSITRRLISINFLICIAFIAFTLIVYFSFDNVEKVLKNIFVSETRRIVKNSNMTRELSRILSEINLVVNTFYGKKDLLKNKGNHALKEIDKLLNQADKNSLKIILIDFKDKIQAVLRHCYKINAVREQIKTLENDFHNNLNYLDNIVAEKLIELIINNEDNTDIEQISTLISGYKSSFVQIELQFMRHGLEHFKGSMHKQKHPLISGLNDLHLRLRTLTASIPAISEHGRKLMNCISEYKRLIPKFHIAGRELKIMLENMDNTREKLLLQMEYTDQQVEEKTDEAGRALSNLISRSLIIIFIIFLGILPVFILGGITALSIKKPIHKLIDYIEQLAKGQIPEKINENFRGEFIRVKENLNILIQATSKVTNIAEDIADGRLDVIVQTRSKNDRLMSALDSMIQSLKKLKKETDTMIHAVSLGQLDISGNADSFRGGWRTLVLGVNDLIKGLSSSVATSIALSNKMELARRIQTSLLPKSLENIHPELEISAAMLTAEQVGGDYYDISKDQENKLWISIGDVSGHGMSPGLIMMMAQTIHTSVTYLTDTDPANAIIRTNEIMFKNVHERLKETHFMTFTTMKYLGSGHFQYAGAHLSMILYRKKTKKCELVKTRGIYLNLKKDISRSIKNRDICMNSGDILVLYTDGLTEAVNPHGKILDIEGLVRIIIKHAVCNPESMKNKILKDVISWCGNHRTDDMAVVIVKRK